MALIAPADPQPSLEGIDYKPSQYITAPIKNSVDGVGQGNNLPSTPVEKRQRDTDWVSMARNAYNSSESWLQVNQRATWARSLAHYRSEHAPDSPILAEANRHRSKHFWPKTRTLVRDIQAAAAAAYFASQDVVVIEGEDQDNKEQVEAAAFIKEILNYRLSTTIPWYQLVLGAISEVAVLGVVASHQTWEYREEDIVLGRELDDTGSSVEYYETKILVDKPVVRVVPVENIRISPAADWLDPANSSPYIIELMPMYVGDILTRIEEGSNSRTGEPAWKNIGEAMLLSAGNRDNLDSTRRARSGSNRLDPKANMMEVEDEFRIVWIHRNIVRHGGKDWLFYTAGTTVLLSDPVPLSDVIPWADGKRDYVLGKIEIETDRPYPSSPVEMASGMQRAINELKNQRYDNVRQVLNRRYLYRAGNQVDVRALSRNVPGGLIGVSAPGPLNNHVEPLNTPDVTGSSFQEEDRLSLAMDDLTGSTTGSTVNSNRRLHETATGMNLMSEAGNRVREMELRTLTETWMEPVLRQLVQLVSAYETDETAMIVAAKKAKVKRILPTFFDHKFSVSVNVGMGAVSPTQRMQKIQTAIATITQLVPDAPLAIIGEEVAKEVMGVAGFDNGSRFFDFAKAAKLKAQQQDPVLQLKQQELQLKQQVEEAKNQLAQQKLELEVQQSHAKLKEMEAQINLLIAKTATENVTAVFEAVNTAGVVVQNPGIAPVSDEILKSSGYKDHNGGVTVPEPAQAQTYIPPAERNTHPNFPVRPDSPERGAKIGLEQGQA